MSNEYSQDYKKDILRLALFIGELMLSNGAETYRVEDSIIRICKSRGFKHINVFITPTVIIISDERFDGLTFMKTIKDRSINLNKVSLLNNFSREFVSNTDMTIPEAIKELKGIASLKPYPKWLNFLGTGLASGSFACLIGGTTLTDFVLTIIIAVFAIVIFDYIKKVSLIPTFATLVSSVFIGTFGVLLTEFGVLVTPKMLIVGSIMPLLPGMAFIKSIRDLISGDLLSGIARMFDAGLTAVSIACGVGFVLDLWFGLGGVL